MMHVKLAGVGVAAASGVIALALAVAHPSVLTAGVSGIAGVSKQAALDNIARQVILPAYRDLASRCTEFAAAADALTSAPTADALKKTQHAWKDVLLAWRRTQPYVHGPIADLGVYGRIQFWPSRRQSVDRVLRAPRPIDEAYIQELGANAVGLSALEIMLFDTRQDEAARLASFTGPQGERQRKYFLALARELVRQAQLVERAWQGPSGFAATFGAGGQKQLNLLVNDMLGAIETGAQGRLRLVIDKQHEQAPLPELVEGALSGTSQQGLLALLEGAQAIFSGGPGIGLDDYLGSLKLQTAHRVDAQFRKAIDAVRAIDGPLEQVAGRREAAIARAHDECRALEILIKVEVASTLGVTLTFRSTDGD
jgi:predicted lipoprotein